MLGKGWQIYKETRKKHDLVFNVYVMRPIAAQVVARRRADRRDAEPGHAPQSVHLHRRRRAAHRAADVRGRPHRHRGPRGELLPRLRRRHARSAQEDRVEGGSPLRLLHRRAQGAAPRGGARRSPLAHAAASASTAVARGLAVVPARRDRGRRRARLGRVAHELRPPARAIAATRRRSRRTTRPSSRRSRSRSSGASRSSSRRSCAS